MTKQARSIEKQLDKLEVKKPNDSEADESLARTIIVPKSEGEEDCLEEDIRVQCF